MFNGVPGALREQAISEKADPPMGANLYDPMDIGDMQKP